MSVLDRQSGSLIPLLFSIAYPIMLTELVQTLYNVIDSAFVSRLSLEGLTALSIVGPAYKLITFIALSNGVGVSILFSRSMGSHQSEKGRQYVFNGYALALLYWGLTVAVGLRLIDPFIRFFSQNETVISLGVSYMRIVILFSIAPYMEGVSVRCLQSLGIAKKPMVFQSAGAVLNILLDPFLIWGIGIFPAMGIAGAAVATVASQCLSAALSVREMFRQTQQKLTVEDRVLTAHHMQDVITAGFPSFVEWLFVSVYIVGLNFLMARFSEEAITALGIYYRIQGFVMIPNDGMMLAVIPVISYCYGAGNYRRIRETVRIGLVVTAAADVVLMVIFLFATRGLMSIFSPTETLMTTGVTALRIISLAFPFFGVTMILPALFQSTGHIWYHIAVTVSRELLFLVPVAWLLTPLGLNATWFTFPISEILAAMMAIFLSGILKRKTNAI